jgi:alpha-beta hydrolase superfamily lysophospholipase
MNLNDFKEQVLEFPDDYEGKVIATLIHSNKNSTPRRSVLYIHGFNDYFFHPHLAESFHKHEYNFYALDLRKYGRSLLPHQHPNYCRDISEYFEEISEAIRIIFDQNSNEIILLGHSTGGLIASLYANYGEEKDRISALILNSPFFDFNVSEIEKSINLFFARLISFFMPYANKSKPLSHLYNRSLLRSYYGEWEFNENWKPERGFPAYFKWIIAINNAQNNLKSTSDISKPVLVMHSTRSLKPKKWSSDILGMDMVLNVNHIKETGQKLGKKVTFLAVDNAIHDIFLSKKQVREKAFNEMINWLNKTIK